MTATAAVDAATAWECPCGREPPKRGSTLTSVRTLVSLREPRCGFCGRPYRDEYRVTDAGEAPGGRSTT